MRVSAAKRSGIGRTLATTACATAMCLALWPSGAEAKRGGSGGGGDRVEIRVAGKCTRGVTAKLKLKTENSGMEVEFEVDQNRSGQRWKVVLIRERRVVFKGYRRTAGRSGSFSIERRISRFRGPNAVVARAWGPRGRTCRASATLPSGA